MATLVSYDLHGVKESFANWISNISPSDTPFTSMTGKESITNKYFQWQTDKLAKVDHSNAVEEGSTAVDGNLEATTVLKNVTQILRKVVKVSDTANALSSYGRGKELEYQTEKAAKELKRDIEWTLLNNPAPGQDIKEPGLPSDAAVGQTGHNVRLTIGFPGLVATNGLASDEDPRAIVHQTAAGATPTEEELFSVTEGLYLAGANCTHIMFAPKFAKFFSGLMEKTDVRKRMFDGAVDTKVNTYVSEIVDPLGQRFTLVPNRFMPADKIYIFNPSDWTQMVLRAPTRIALSKVGSFERSMIEVELGLRHKNPFASGILEIGTTQAPGVDVIAAGPVQYSANGTSGWASTIPASALKAGTAVDYFVQVNPTGTNPADDGTYKFAFKLVGEKDGDGGDTAGIGGLSLTWTGNKGHITGTVPADQVGKKITIEGSITDTQGKTVKGTSLVGTWTA